MRRIPERSDARLRRFQSTHSLRSATSGTENRPLRSIVSIHALLAECDPRKYLFERGVSVSIHALLAECDFLGLHAGFHAQGFQSTHSLRSATCWTYTRRRWMRFQSTHSLRSATQSVRVQEPSDSRFNPRTPCGVRHPDKMTILPHNWFQSTHSLRSATRTVLINKHKSRVSIHALLAECDR